MGISIHPVVIDNYRKFLVDEYFVKCVMCLSSIYWPSSIFTHPILFLWYMINLTFPCLVLILWVCYIYIYIFFRRRRKILISTEFNFQKMTYRKLLMGPNTSSLYHSFLIKIKNIREFTFMYQKLQWKKKNPENMFLMHIGRFTQAFWTDHETISMWWKV